MTFVVSSGDHGVAYGSQECYVNGTLVSHPDKGGFVGQFPASCPYVTAVGATQLATNDTVRSSPSRLPTRVLTRLSIAHSQCAVTVV